MSRAEIVNGIEKGLREGKAEEISVSKKSIRKAAIALAKSFEKLNGKSLTRLYQLAQEAYENDDYGRRHGGANNRHVRTEEDFGFYLGMTAQGHGISWNDDVMNIPRDYIKHPYIEVY